MTVSRVKLGAFAAFLLLAGASPAMAQEEPAEPDTQASEDQGGRADPLDLLLPPEPRDTGPGEDIRPATGNLRIIRLGPYIQPGTMDEWRRRGEARRAGEEADARLEDESADRFGRRNTQDNRRGSDRDTNNQRRPIDLSGRPITQGALDELDDAAIGTLFAGQGGLDANIWSGSGRQQVGRLIAALPSHVASPTLQSLRRRLLLSSLAYPRETRRRSQDQTDILRLRLEKLAEAGMIDGLLALLGAADGAGEADFVRALQVDAYLWDQNVDGACRIAEQTQILDTGPGFLDVLAFCHARAGDEARANLVLELLEESGADTDALRAQIDTLLYGPIEIDDVEIVDGFGAGTGRLDKALENAPAVPEVRLAALDLALLDAIGEGGYPAGSVSQQGLLLTALATRGDLPLADRLRWADKAVGIGALSPIRFAEIVKALVNMPESPLQILLPEEPVSLPGEDRLADLPGTNDGLDGDATAEDEAPEFDPANSFLTHAATIYQIHNATDARTAARLLMQGLGRARAEGRYHVLAAAYLEAVQPWIGDDWPTADMARVAALYAFTGEAAGVVTIAGLLRERINFADRSPNRELVRIWPLMAITSVRVSGIARDLRLWWSLAEEQGRMAHADTLFALLEALDMPVAERIWDQLAAADVPRMSGRTIPVSQWRQLTRAEQNGARGEVLALLLIALGDAGTLEMSPAMLSQAVHGLKQAGFEREARQLAIEALVLNGVIDG